MGDEEKNKANDQQQGDQTDYKAEFEKLKAANDTLQKSNEELRLEFMSDEYLEFLNTKETGKGGADKGKAEEKKAEATKSDELKGLTPDQIYEKAMKAAEDKINSKLTEFQQKQKEEQENRTKVEVRKFAESHDDYETFRPIMYGLSLDPKNSDLSLKELYDKSKAHVKAINTGPSDEDKAKSRKSQGEKPGHSSSSFKKDSGGKQLSPDDAAEEAWSEVVGKDGLPSAF